MNSRHEEESLYSTSQTSEAQERAQEITWQTYRPISQLQKCANDPYNYNYDIQCTVNSELRFFKNLLWLLMSPNILSSKSRHLVLNAHTHSAHSRYIFRKSLPLPSPLLTWDGNFQYVEELFSPLHQAKYTEKSPESNFKDLAQFLKITWQPIKQTTNCVKGQRQYIAVTVSLLEWW